MTETPTETLVTVFGGSGFLGRHVVRALAREGYRLRPAVRRPDLAGHLQPLGRVGQIHAVQANLRYPASVEAAVRDADVVINLVGILFEVEEVRGGARGGRSGSAGSGSGGSHDTCVGARGDPDAPALYAAPRRRARAAVLAGARARRSTGSYVRRRTIIQPLFRVHAFSACLVGGRRTKFHGVRGDVARRCRRRATHKTARL